MGGPPHETHTGQLELVEWSMRGGPEIVDSDGEDEEAMGWGFTLAEESSELRAQFEEKHSARTPADLAAFFDSRHDGCFRWTCCGSEGGTVCGCDHHGEGCSCDYCNCSPFASMGRSMSGMRAAEGAAPYRPSSTNRFLRLPNGPSGEWELCFGVPWSDLAHRHLPPSFRQQTRELLLCWQRTQLSGPVAQLVVEQMWEGRLVQMIRREKQGKCAQCGSTGAGSGELCRCSRCRQVFYCGRRCQKLHWASHKATCRKKPQNKQNK